MNQLCSYDECIVAMREADRRLSDTGARERLDIAINKNIIDGHMERQKAINVAIANVMREIEAPKEDVPEVSLVELEALASQLLSENSAMSPRKARQVAHYRLMARAIAEWRERNPNGGQP